MPPGRAFALSAPSPASQSQYESWRRPACSDACTSQRVLVAEGGFRGWRDVVTHDHAAYERKLEATVIGLTGLLASAVLPPVLDPTAAMLGVLLARATTRIDVGSLAIDLLMDVVMVDGRPIAVSPREWELLVVLALNVGELVSYEDLKLWVWPSARLHVGRAPSGQPTRQSLRALVGRLRKRLGEAGSVLVTVRDQGCMLRSIAMGEVS